MEPRQSLIYTSHPGRLTSATPTEKLAVVIFSSFSFSSAGPPSTIFEKCQLKVPSVQI